MSQPIKERPILFSSPMVRAILEDRKTQTRRVIKPQPEYVENGMYKWRRWLPWLPQDAHLLVEHCPFGAPGDPSFGVSGDLNWQRGMPPADGWYYVDGLSDPAPVWLCPFLPEDYPGEEVERGLLWGRDEHDDPEAIELEGLSLDTIQWKRPGDRLWVRETWAVVNTLDNRKPSEITKGTHYWPTVWYRATDQHEQEYRDDYFGKWRPSIFMPRWASRITLEITDVRVERVQDISMADCIAEGMSMDAPLNNRGTGAIARDAFADLWDLLNAKRGFGWDVNPWVWIIEFRKLKEAAI